MSAKARPFVPKPGSMSRRIQVSFDTCLKMLTVVTFSPRITTSTFPSPSRSPVLMSWVPAPENEFRFCQVPVADAPLRRGFSYQLSPTIPSIPPSPTMSVTQLPLCVLPAVSIVYLFQLGYLYQTTWLPSPPTIMSMKPSPSRSAIRLAQGSKGLLLSITIFVKGVSAAYTDGRLNAPKSASALQRLTHLCIILSIMFFPLSR